MPVSSCSRSDTAPAADCTLALSPPGVQKPTASFPESNTDTERLGPACPPAGPKNQAKQMKERQVTQRGLLLQGQPEAERRACDPAWEPTVGTSAAPCQPRQGAVLAPGVRRRSRASAGKGILGKRASGTQRLPPARAPQHPHSPAVSAVPAAFTAAPRVSFPGAAACGGGGPREARNLLPERDSPDVAHSYARGCAAPSWLVPRRSSPPSVGNQWLGRRLVTSLARRRGREAHVRQPSFV